MEKDPSLDIAGSLQTLVCFARLIPSPSPRCPSPYATFHRNATFVVIINYNSRATHPSYQQQHLSWPAPHHRCSTTKRMVVPSKDGGAMIRGPNGCEVMLMSGAFPSLEAACGHGCCCCWVPVGI